MTAYTHFSRSRKNARFKNEIFKDGIFKSIKNLYRGKMGFLLSFINHLMRGEN